MKNNTVAIAIAALLASNQAFAGGAEENTKKDHDKVVMDRVMVIGNSDNVENIAGSAHFIDKETLDQNKYTDINRVLKQIPGVNIREEEGFGNRPNIGLRGGRVNRSADITLMEDGVLIAPAPYAAPDAYYFPRVIRMEAVEVRKGSSTIEFGPRTTNGALNLVSSSTPEEAEFEFLAGGGSFNTKLLKIHQGNKVGNFSYVIDANHEESDGFKKIDIVGGDTGYSIQDVMAKFKVTSDDDADIYQSLELKLGYTQEDSNETYLGLTTQDFNNDPYRRYAASQVDNMKADHQTYQLRHFADFDAFDLTTTLYRHDFARNWYKLRDTVTDNSDQTGLTIRANNREYYSQGVQSVLGTKFRTGDLNHKLKVSARYHVDEEDRLQRDDTYDLVNGVMQLDSYGVDGGAGNREAKARAVSLFVKDEIKYDKLTLTPGIRYEQIKLERRDRTSGSENRNHVNAYVPGLGALYQFNDNISTFASVHKGFAPPTPGNSDNQKEESTNYEAGLRYNSNSFRTELVGFFNDYSNLLGSCTLSSGGSCTEGDQYNAGEVDVKGIELSASYDLAQGLNISKYKLPIAANYTFTNAEFKNNFDSNFSEWGNVKAGYELPYLAEHQFFVSVGIEAKKWEIHLNGKYTGKMRNTAGSGPIAQDQVIDSNFIVDLAGEVEIAKNTRWFLNLENVTDEQYVVARRPIGARPGKPFAVLTGIKYKF